MVNTARAGEPFGELERVNQELKEMFTMFLSLIYIRMENRTNVLGTSTSF